MIAALTWARRGAPKTGLPIVDDLGAGSDDGPPEPQSGSEDEDDSNIPGALRGENLMFYRDGKDPYLTNVDELSEDSIDDFAISETDLVLVGARSDESISNLEVYVYEEQQDNLYAHHDIPLPVFPLCLAWMDYARNRPNGRGNYVAVGTFAPYIELWDLDVIDALEPLGVLGAEGAEASASRLDAHAAEALAAGNKQRKGEKAMKKKKKKDQAPESSATLEGHTDAVMGLAWNRWQRNVLASASADESVRLWDLSGSGEGSVQAFHHHKDKVQTLQWHPKEGPVMVTASFDQTAAVVDVRAAEATRSYNISAEAEKVSWDPHGGSSFVVTTEDGWMRCFDVRGGDSTLWQIKAHKESASALDWCPGAANIIATGSQDKLVKLWCVSSDTPKLIEKKNLQLGAVFDIKFCEDSPALLGVGGAKGKLGIWNTLELEEMQTRLPGAHAALGEDGRVLGGAVAGMSAMDVNTDSDASDGEQPRTAEAEESEEQSDGDDVGDRVPVNRHASSAQSSRHSQPRGMQQRKKKKLVSNVKNRK